MTKGVIDNMRNTTKMKRILAVLLIIAMAMGMAACGNNGGGADTVGGILVEEFKANSDGTPQEIADQLLANEIIAFPGATMPVEPGLLAGFDNAEIKGFEEGVMFSPMMGTIPFVGYIFTLEEGTDVESFKQTLQDNANLRWNICTEAEELVVDNVDNKVFFLMCPKSFDEGE